MSGKPDRAPSLAERFFGRYARAWAEANARLSDRAVRLWMIVAYAAAVPPVLAILYGATLIIASGRYDLAGRLGGLLLIPALGAAGAFLLGRAYGREVRRRRRARAGG